MSNIAPTSADVLLRYPQFKDREVIQFHLDFATVYFDKDGWGEFYSQGVMLMIAHELTLEAFASQPNGAMQGAAGPISSTSAGGMSISFNAAQYSTKSARDQYFSKTLYGQQLIRLWNTVISPAYIV